MAFWLKTAGWSRFWAEKSRSHTKMIKNAVWAIPFCGGFVYNNYSTVGVFCKSRCGAKNALPRLGCNFTDLF